MSWDPVWEKVFSQQAWGKYPAENLIRFIARNFYNVSDRSKINILEVGCGPGANIWYLAREGFSVYGMDGSRTAISQANDRLNIECPGWNGSLVDGDIAQLSFEDGFFDAVIDNEAIYCNSFDYSQRIYQEMSRVTKKGGLLYSRTFAEGSWGDKTGENTGHNQWVAAEGPLAGKGSSRFTSLDEIESLVAGFVVSETELLSWTLNARENEVKEWIIIGEKK